ncbi:MAG: sugar porter family MFS transporter [Bacteroidetes bacterium]|nr:sugar porter family MFS transporter [Fibrella sp.]
MNAPETQPAAPNRTVLFCYLIGLGGLLFGFDTAVISGTLQLVATQFGLDALAEGQYVSVGLYGAIAGVLVSGVLSDRVGRKWATLLSAVLYAGSGIGCALATGLTGLCVFRFLGGLAVGLTSTLVPLYISELAPAAKRGRLVAVYQLLLTAGILLAYVSNALIYNYFSKPGLTGLLADEPWRPMYVALAVPALLYVLALLPLPESPRWLLTRGRSAEARLLADRYGIVLAGGNSPVVPLSALFGRGNRGKLLVGLAIPFLGQFSGINAVIYYGPRIFEQIGFGSGSSLQVQILIGLINLLTTFIAVTMVDRVGRKPLLIYGLLGLIGCLLALAGLSGTAPAGWLVGLVLAFIFCYAFSLGPVQWVVIGELFPASIRGRAISLCTLALWLAATLVGQFFPWLLERVGIQAAFGFFAGMSGLLLLLIGRTLVETKGQTLESLERGWQVSAETRP